MSIYTVTEERLLEIAKASFDPIDYSILEFYLQGKSTDEIVSALTEFRVTPYLVWCVTHRWLDYFRREPLNEPFAYTSKSIH